MADLDTQMHANKAAECSKWLCARTQLKNNSVREMAVLKRKNAIAQHLRARNGNPGNAKPKHESQYAVLTTNARNIQQHAIAEILRARTGRPRRKDNDTMTQHTIQE